jgi:PAS domain S-box-containing protein
VLERRAPPASHRGALQPGALSLAVGLALLLLLVMVAWLTLDASRSRDQLRDRQVLLTRVLEDHATRSIDAGLLALGAVANLAARDAPADLAAATLAQTLASLPYLREVAWLDDSGRVLASSDAAAVGRILDLSPLGPLPPSGSSAVGPFVAARTLTELTRGLPRPPVPAGVGFVPLLRTVGSPRSGTLTALALWNPDAVANYQALTVGEPEDGAALLTLDGRVLAATTAAGRAPGDRLESAASLTWLQQARQGDDHAVWEGPGLREGRQLGAYRVLRDHPLLVVVERDHAQWWRYWQARVRWPALAGLVAAAGLALLGLLARRSSEARERARAALDDAQRALQAREQALSAIFGSVQDILFSTDAQGRVTTLNTRWAQISGRPVESMIGQPLARLFDAGAGLDDLSGDSVATDPGAPVTRRATLQGSQAAPPRQLAVSLVPLRDSQCFLGWVGSATDLTDLLQAQSEAIAQLGFARSLIANSPAPTSVLDRQNCYLEVNRAWEQFTGLKREQVLGRQARSFLPPEEAGRHDAQDRELLAQGGEIRYEAPRADRDGRQRLLYISKSTFPGPDGTPGGIVVAFMDISEFREAERATRKARDLALQASQAKSEFIANVSHELRTPLQSILGFSELGRLRARASTPKMADMFDEVHRAGQRMLALVNDLLDLSKIEGAAETLQPERQDLRPLVQEVAGELEPLCGPRRLTVALQAPQAQVVALVDGVRFSQVVRNVMANAVKFSPDGGRIDVRLLVDPTHAGREIRLTVADRGPGVPADEMERIFEAFVQSSRTKTGAGGTGLGLAICRRIVEAHGGQIAAAAREGGGSVFTVTLPAAVFGDTTPAAL